MAIAIDILINVSANNKTPAVSQTPVAVTIIAIAGVGQWIDRIETLDRVVRLLLPVEPVLAYGMLFH